MKINPKKQCEIGLLPIACLVLFAFAFSARAEAQWKVFDVTDDFTGEFSRRAVSPLAAAKGGPWFTTQGGLFVWCGGTGKDMLAGLLFDYFVFHDEGRYASKKFSTNADGKIERWKATDSDSGKALYVYATDRFVDMLAYAKSLKVRARSHHDGYATMDINMEGAEQAIRKACPNYSPRNRKQADAPPGTERNPQ